MNQASIGSCQQPEESGMVRTCKIICGSCIMCAVAVPVVLIVLFVLARFFGYI